MPSQSKTAEAGTPAVLRDNVDTEDRRYLTSHNEKQVSQERWEAEFQFARIRRKPSIEVVRKRRRPHE
jgi:hypothetical protein